MVFELAGTHVLRIEFLITAELLLKDRHIITK